MLLPACKGFPSSEPGGERRTRHLKAPNLLRAALVFMSVGSAVSLHGQTQPVAGADLFVCNKGTVPVEVVFAIRGDDWPRRGFGKYYWTIKGWTLVPQKCGVIKNPDGDPSYIAFGI